MAFLIGCMIVIGIVVALCNRECGKPRGGGGRSGGGGGSGPRTITSEEREKGVEAMEREIKNKISGRIRCIAEEEERIRQLEKQYEETHSAGLVYEIQKSKQRIDELMREINTLRSEL